MKQLIIFLHLAVFCLSFPSLTKGITYKSSESDAYYESVRQNRRTLPTSEDVLSFQSEGFTVSEIDYVKIYGPHYLENDSVDFFNPYDENLRWRNPYYLKYDSIRNYFLTLPPQVLDTIDVSLFIESIGGISVGDIIKHEKNGDLEVILYNDHRYNGSFFSNDVGLAISKDNRATWNYYYTGLSLRQPIDLKWYSKIPLIVDENAFQIEAAALRQTKEFSLPTGVGAFEVAKDGLVVTFDLNVLSRDSDGDGLTDILERKFRTDPYNADTNGNGIADNIDANPRFNVPPSERTIIYQMLIDKAFAPIEYADNEDWEKMSPDNKRKATLDIWHWPLVEFDHSSFAPTHVKDSARTVLIVSDDPALHAVQPKYARVIILTREEYGLTKSSVFLSELYIMSISPFFKIDNKENQYLLRTNYLTAGATYLIKRTDKGWIVEQISAYII